MSIEVKCAVDGKKLFEISGSTIKIMCPSKRHVKRIIEIPIDELIRASKDGKTVLKV